MSLLNIFGGGILIPQVGATEAVPGTTIVEDGGTYVLNDVTGMASPQIQLFAAEGGERVVMSNRAGTTSTWEAIPATGQRINGLAVDEALVLDVPNVAFELIYTGDADLGWQIVSINT